MTDDDTPGLVMPVLLASARSTYGATIRRDLMAAGFDDMPRLGPRLVGGLARNGSHVGDFAAGLGTSKQAASQLVDTMVARGYVERTPDPDDRRRVVVTLTERGRAAAHVVRHAVDAVDGELIGRVGADRLDGAREVLEVLLELHPGRHG